MTKTKSKVRGTTRNCIYCTVEFIAREEKHISCNSKACKKQRLKEYDKIRHQAKGLVPKNLWANGDYLILESNRFASDAELTKLIGRPQASIRQERSKRKLPQLALCTECDATFEKINQVTTCPECTPTEEEYRVAYRDSIKGRWQMYKSGAKKRGIEYLLTIQDVTNLWQQPCRYCGDDIATVGIDRVDSSKAYSLDNVVPCCSRCNEMKMAETKEDWINQMKQILRHQGETL